MANLLLLAFGLIAFSAKANSVNLCADALLDPQVQEMIQHIDQTAARLKTAGKLTSPTTWRSTIPELAALDLPAFLGGQDFSAEQMAALFEHAGTHALDLRDVVGAGHARMLARSKHAEVLDVVRKVALGEAYVAIAITEENAGSDLHAMKSTAEKTTGGYLLTGAKLYNARLKNASHVIVFTQSPVAPGRLNAFVIPLDHPDLKITQLDAPGLNGNSFGGLSFERLFVPSKMAVGTDAQGGQIFRAHFLYWRLMMAASALGTARGALDQVAPRLRSREAFGAPIGRFTHLQQELAEHTAKLHMARLLIREAARKIDAGDESATALVAMAKAEGVEFALAAADFAMRTFGAEGYSSRVDLGQRVIDLMGLRIADGTTDVMRSDVVRQIYGQDLRDMAVSSPRGGGISFGAAPLKLAPPSWAEILSGLQGDPGALAIQGNYDGLIRSGGGGACAMVTAFNLLQALYTTENPGQLLNPAAVIADAYLRFPDLLDGRVTNDQLLRLLRHYKKHFLRREYDFRFQVNLPDATQSLYIYRIYLADESYIGRHFVVVKSKIDSALTVVAPERPDRDYRFEVHSGDQGIELRSDKITDGRRFELDSILTWSESVPTSPVH